jgi:hypothetical protein
VFLLSIKRGRQGADTKVAKSLYQKALGYSIREVKIVATKDGVVKVPYTKHFPPSTTAIIFWLLNRQKEYWKDVRHLMHSGPDGGPIPLKVTNLRKLDLSDFTDEQLAVLEEVGIKVREQIEKEEGEIKT